MSYYDIDLAIATGKLTPYDRFTSDPHNHLEVMSWLIYDRAFFDPDTSIVYIPDIGDGHLYGVMTAELDLDEIDSNERLDMYALDNFPAPGTGAPDRMGFMEVDEACEWLAEIGDRVLLVNEH